MTKHRFATIAVLLLLSLIQCSSANRSIFDGKSHITINQQQRSLRQSISEWSSSMYNKVHNKKNSGGTKKCMKKHWWNTHCDTASSSYADGYNAGYEDGKSYTDGYNAGYDAAGGSSSSSSNASDGYGYDETDEEDYDEDTSSSQAQDTSSSYIQTTQLDYTNNADGGGGASVFLFFLAAFAGIAVGIAGMAVRVS